MVRTMRPLLLALLVLTIATVANACLSAPGNAGSCCAPAPAAQRATCCQNPQAASLSPCCSTYSAQPAQIPQASWSAPQLSAPQSSVGCPSGGCSSASSGGGGGCSGGGCANGGFSNGASGSVGGGSNVGCAGGSTGSGCSENSDGNAYDASAEYQTSTEVSGHTGGADSDYYEDDDTQENGQANAQHENVASNNKNITSNERTNEGSPPQEHVDIPERKTQKVEQVEKHVEISEEKTRVVEQSQEHANIPARKSKKVKPPVEHIDIPERKSQKVKQREEISTVAPVEHTEASGYTDAPPALPSRAKKAQEGERSLTAEELNEIIRREPLEESHKVGESELTDLFGDSREFGPEEEEAACQFLTCDFEKNALCLYETSPDEKPKRIRLSTVVTGVSRRRGRFLRAVRFLSRKWEIVSGRYHNRVTGIREAGTGEKYAATYLRPKERSILTTDNLYYKKTRMIFQAYEATKGIEMRMCCDSLDNCPWRSNIDVRPREKKWHNRVGSCPKGTKKILFVCENSGKYQGACGLDNVRVDGHSCAANNPKEFFIEANL